MKKMILDYTLIMVCLLLTLGLLFAINVSYDLRADEVSDVIDLFLGDDMFSEIDGVSYIDFFTGVKQYSSDFRDLSEATMSSDKAFMCMLAEIACTVSFVLGWYVMIIGALCILGLAIVLIYTLCCPKKAIEEEKKDSLQGIFGKAMITLPITAYVSLLLPVIFGNLAFRTVWGDNTAYQFDLSFAGGINYLVVMIIVLVVYIVGKLVIRYVVSNQEAQ